MSNGRGLVIVAGGAALGLPAPVQAQGGPYYGYGPGMMWDGGGWFDMLSGLLMMLLFLGVVVVLVVLGVRWLGAAENSPFRQVPGSGQRNPLEFADQHPQST